MWPGLERDGLDVSQQKRAALPRCSLIVSARRNPPAGTTCINSRGTFDASFDVDFVQVMAAHCMCHALAEHRLQDLSVVGSMALFW